MAETRSRHQGVRPLSLGLKEAEELVEGAEPILERSTRKRPKRRRPPLKAPARRFLRLGLSNANPQRGAEDNSAPCCVGFGQIRSRPGHKSPAYLLLDSSIPGHHLGTHTPGADPSGRGLSRGLQGSGSLSPHGGRSDRGTVGVPQVGQRRALRVCCCLRCPLYSRIPADHSHSCADLTGWST